MGTTADKLGYLSNTKELIRQAIIQKGVNVSENETFRTYPEKIQQIETGGGAEWGEIHVDILFNPFDEIGEEREIDIEDLFSEIIEIEEVI